MNVDNVSRWGDLPILRIKVSTQKFGLTCLRPLEKVFQHAKNEGRKEEKERGEIKV